MLLMLLLLTKKAIQQNFPIFVLITLKHSLQQTPCFISLDFSMLILVQIFCVQFTQNAQSNFILTSFIQPKFWQDHARLTKTYTFHKSNCFYAVIYLERTTFFKGNSNTVTGIRRKMKFTALSHVYTHLGK
jgi:hypothetical protein